jgi:penicillin-binding protein 1A
VGGRDFGVSQFDRAGSAKRQAGSSFKPFVYLTAFERRVATPASIVEDGPLRLVSAGTPWEPEKTDGRFRGWVTARQALTDSLNDPTVRLAMVAGLQEIVDTARR